MKLDLHMEELELVDVPMGFWATVGCIAGAGAAGMLVGAGIALLIT